MMFVSTQEVAAMWKVIDPIIEAWQKNLVPLETYKPDTQPIS
jgi:glucose-6-phosphate 1-dehydrogenase